MPAPAFPHDPIKKLYPNIYLLHGSIKMGPGMRMSRNMLIIKDGNDLTLINPVRMKEQGLKELESLGNILRIMRLGDFHGLDDQFYLDRYQCEFWAQAGQETYKHPKPTHTISYQTNSPISNSEFFIFKTALYPEAALLIKNHKLLITTDSIQYYDDWSYFSPLTKFAFKLLRFKKGLNIGPPWAKRATPKGQCLKEDFEELLKLDFESLIAAHGSLLTSNVKDLLKEEINRSL